MHFMSLIISSFVILETSSDNYNCGSFLLCFSTMILVLFFTMSPLCVCVYTSTLIFYNALRDNIKPKMLIMLISFSRKNFSLPGCLGHSSSGILSFQFQRLRCFEGAWFFCEVLCTSRSLPFLGCCPSGSQTIRK